MSRDLAMFVTGFAVGVGLMYVLDPDRGNARREMMRDKLTSWANDAREMAEKKARHLGDRAQGWMQEAGSLVGAGGRG